MSHLYVLSAFRRWSAKIVCYDFCFVLFCCFCLYKSWQSMSEPSKIPKLDEFNTKKRMKCVNYKYERVRKSKRSYIVHKMFKCILLFGLVINIYRRHKLITFAIYSMYVIGINFWYTQLQLAWKMNIILYYLFGTLNIEIMLVPLFLFCSHPIPGLNHHQNIFIYFSPFSPITWTCIFHAKNR